MLKEEDYPSIIDAAILWAHFQLVVHKYDYNSFKTLTDTECFLPGNLLTLKCNLTDMPKELCIYDFKQFLDLH